ncbi:hypothetical protein ACWGJT_00240 [Streptomyces xantholiticus]
MVLEGELRETVATEIAFAAAGLEQAVTVRTGALDAAARPGGWVRR